MAPRHELTSECLHRLDGLEQPVVAQTTGALLLLMSTHYRAHAMPPVLMWVLRIQIRLGWQMLLSMKLFP